MNLTKNPKLLIGKLWTYYQKQNPIVYLLLLTTVVSVEIYLYANSTNVPTYVSFIEIILAIPISRVIVNSPKRWLKILTFLMSMVLGTLIVIAIVATAGHPPPPSPEIQAITTNTILGVFTQVMLISGVWIVVRYIVQHSNQSLKLFVYFCFLTFLISILLILIFISTQLFAINTKLDLLIEQLPIS